MRSVIALSLIFSGVVAFACESKRDEVTSIVDSRLEASLIGGDVHRVIAIAKGFRHGDVCNSANVLLDVWEQRIDKHPGYSWRALRDKTLMLNIANNLAQAKSNGCIQFQEDEMRKYVRETMANESDSATLELAVWTLGIFDRSEDVALIEKFASSNAEAVFRSSVMALSNMCNADSELAIERLLATSTQKRQTFIAETSMKLKQFNEDVCRIREKKKKGKDSD